MAARIVTLTQAVAQYLADQVFLQDVQVFRANFVALRAEELLLPKLYVTPIATATTVETRAVWQDNFQIGLTLAQTLNTMSIGEQDVLIDIAERIPHALLDFQVDNTWMDNVNDESSRATFDEVEMETGTIFVSYLTINFRSEA